MNTDFSGALVPLSDGDFPAPTDLRWVRIPNHSGYEATRSGSIRSVPRTIQCRDGRSRRLPGQELTGYPNHDGRLYVTLGGRRRRYVHQLVLETFVGPAPDGMEGCHNDGNNQNNHICNLRWDTHGSNMCDRRRHGTDPMVNRETCPWSHPLVEPNLVPLLLEKHRHRACLACSRATANQAWMRSKGVEIDFQAVSDAHYAEILAGRRVSPPGPRPTTYRCVDTECGRKVWARGKCRKHYQIWWRSQRTEKAAI